MARFVRHRKDVRADGTIKPRHYEPEVNPGARLETSVQRTLHLTDEDLRDIAQRELGDRGYNCYGLTRCIASVPLNLGLQVIEDWPPESHAVLVDWPAEKEARQELAIVLAADSTFEPSPLIVRPDPAGGDAADSGDRPTA